MTHTTIRLKDSSACESAPFLIKQFSAFSVCLNQTYLQNVTVGKHLLPAVDYFLQVLLQVVAGTDVGMAAKREMVPEIHLLLQAVVGKD